MNKIKLAIAFSFLFTIIAAPFSFADRSEKAQVVKFDKNMNDLIVERRGGERWLIQHNRKCGSMSIDFPVTLIWNGDKMKYLKVNFNEICKVYNATPYGGEGKLVKLIKSENLIIPDHEGEVIWKNQKYMIDYKKGCRQFYDFIDKKIYFEFTNSKKTKGNIILPSNRGQCGFEFTDTLEKLPDETPNAPAKLEGLAHQAQSNQVYFYWNRPETDDKLLYLISHSRRRLNMEDYTHYRQMPKLKFTPRNSYTVRQLANGRTYYFYLAARNSKGIIGEWTEVIATPIANPADKKINNPDLAEFEIEVADAGDHFLLTWPKMNNVRRYFAHFYAGGKRQFFRILRPDIHELVVPKKPEYLGKGLKLTIRTTPTKAYLPRHYDGIYWEYKSD